MATLETNVSALNFTNIVELSFTVYVDTLWGIVDAYPHPSLSDAILGYVVGETSITFYWTDISLSGVSIPNGEAILNITLDYIGTGDNCGITSTMRLEGVTVIPLNGSSIRTRVINGALEACFTLGPIEPITITCINPPTINTSPGDSIILDFAVNNFYRIRELDFTIYFSATQWEFLEMVYINPLLTNLSVYSNFNTTQLSNGLIGVSWVHPYSDTTIPTDTVIFSMALQSKPTSFCGLPTNVGLNSDLVVMRALEAASLTEVVVQNSPVALEVCTIVVPPNTDGLPVGLALQVVNPEYDGQNYDPTIGGFIFTVNVLCSNFLNIKYFQFTLQYRLRDGYGPGQFGGHTINMQALPGNLVEGSWNNSYQQAEVPFTWDNGTTGLTIPDNEILFTINLSVAPGFRCDLISFIDITANAIPLLARKGVTNTQVSIQPGQRIVVSICDE